jgi:protein TonB
MNGRAIELPTVPYPKGARVSGSVSVQVLVDENGNVVSAEAIDGPSELRQAATQAAMKAHFFQTRLLGHPVKVIGTVSHAFVFGR